MNEFIPNLPQLPRSHLCWCSAYMQHFQIPSHKLGRPNWTGLYLDMDRPAELTWLHVSAPHIYIHLPPHPPFLWFTDDSNPEAE